MIRDVIIIKDGLPLLSKNFSNSQKLFSQGDNLILMSGFFSALNSFSDQFDNLGTISELKLSNNDLQLSFLKDSSIPNLIYLATFDENSKGVNVQRVLRKISRTFLQQYNIDQILKWCGRKDTFKEFEGQIKEFINQEKKENEVEFKDKVVELFKTVKEKINEDNNSLEENRADLLPDFYNHVPVLKISKKINPRYYLTGETSNKVFYQIDGKKTINQIATELELNQEEVYNICKNLIKIGFLIINTI